MNRDYLRWYSSGLHREMELLVLGHAGAKVLVFPTRDGRFHEYEDLNIAQSLAARIDAGELQLWCVDSIDRESFYCFWRQPAERIRRHMLFEDYILNEVMPRMSWTNPHPCTIAHGCSLGAFHAANIAFRHPDRFQKLVALSGRYDLTLKVDDFYDLFSGHYDENIYFHTPIHFLPNLNCDWRLDHLRRMEIVIVVGADDPFLDNNRHLSAILDAKGFLHQLHVWEGRAHRGSCWRKMVPLYL
jgi:esterase/lipase superfamily enzyme